MNFFEKVYEAVKQIPIGKVATYGQIAFAVGSPRAARQVGFALHVNPQPGVIPCHRVVNRFGRMAPAFAFGGEDVQADLLRAEGVSVKDDLTVDLRRYQYQGEFNIGD
ncbi:MAG: MGMT family protein [Clostridia bacterium]|nr:MGMT family protein [Clostridia bacterium]